jgi:tetratricopeptide (TPR) repeat protein
MPAFFRRSLCAFVWLTVSLLCACANKAKQAADHAQAGLDKCNKGDLTGALADLDQAIALAAAPSAEYFNDRGMVKLARNDFPGAIADATQATVLNPAFGPAFGNRALAEQDKGDLPAAAADFTKAIQLQPAFAPYYGYRGELRQNQNDFAGAVEDYDKFISLQPAAAPFVQLYRHVLLRRLGRDPGDLAAASATWKDEWPQTLALFLAGKMSEADLLATAQKGPNDTATDRQCQANYFIGELHLINHDPAGARPPIVLSASLEGTNCDEYGFARTELARLDQTSPGNVH